MHPEIAAGLVHVPLERDERGRKTREKGVARRGVGRGVRLRERLEGRRVAVGRAPQRGGLLLPPGLLGRLGVRREHESKDDEDEEEERKRVLLPCVFMRGS